MCVPCQENSEMSSLKQNQSRAGEHLDGSVEPYKEWFGILYKSKSLFFPNWVNNNINLVSQLLNSDGYLYSYSEFLNKYNIPVTPREFAIVMDAIPCRAFSLLKGSARSQFSLSKIHTFDTMLGEICFLSLSSGRNKRIRQLFQAEITSLPCIVSHWNGLYDNIPWKKAWTLSSKYLITNTVKEVSYKLLHLFYPVKLYIIYFFPDTGSLCSFVRLKMMSHLFWECTYTNLFWKYFFIFVHAWVYFCYINMSYLVVITLLKKTTTNIIW